MLVEVYGEGILLIGDSGIGSAEAAVELLKRGHRLIADDAVEIRKVSTNSLVGTAPKLIRNYIELRGIGIINVAKLFGMGAVRTENEINLIVNIVPWNTQEVYDRLGLEEQYMELLGVKVPMNTIPITPGRNLAMILEVAAMNNRQKAWLQRRAGVHGAGQPTFRRKYGKERMKEFTIGQNDAGQRLDRFLAKAVPLLPASLAQKYIRIKRIKCNGKRIDRDTRLQEGDVLQLYINDEFFDKPREDNAYLTVANPNLNIIYEDEKHSACGQAPCLAVHPHDGAEYGRTPDRPHIQSYLGPEAGVASRGKRLHPGAVQPH